MSKNMYQTSNLSCRISNVNTIDNLLGVMETDFLNFHDEEHFGTALYQNELLDDSQSSLLDIVGDAYTRQESGDYGDHSIIWEQDVERELNGDVAVIPMSGQINTFPKLSNSPPSKDFHKIFSDWQHITAIEAAPTEDLTSDLSLQNQGVVVDMLDYLPPISLPPTDSLDIQPSSSKILETNPVIPTFDFSSTTIPKLPSTPTFEPSVSVKEIKKEIVDPKPTMTRKTGGKNLALLKQVVKEEIDLDNSFKSEVLSSDELDLDSANDSFDITSYVNGDDDLPQSAKKKPEKTAKSSKSSKIENRTYSRKYGGCYEKNMPLGSSESEDEEDEKQTAEAEKQEDSEEESIDVETVSEQMPVLQARDVNSLWEQFEANEAANPTLPQNVFEDKPEIEPLNNSNVSTEQPKSTSLDNCQTHNATTQQFPNEIKSKIKQVNPELKQPTNKQNTSSKITSEAVPIELIKKMKASSAKKSISVIPAMPSKKARGTRIQEAGAQLSRNKLLKIVSPANCNNESVQLDHDYCTVSPLKSNNRRCSSDSDVNPKKAHSPDSTSTSVKNDKCDKTQKIASDTINEVKRNLGTIIDDTAIRIGKQIKNAINNENALKQKLMMCRNQAGDGKVMISLLKPNVRNTNIVKKANTIVNTVNTSDEQIRNIIVSDISEECQRNAKKRKLNLEEYKKLRGDIIKTNSCDNSGTNSPRDSGSNSPIPGETKKEEKYQELIMKMASEILKTNAKSKQGTCETKLEQFVPPEVKKSPKFEEAKKLSANTPKEVKLVKENYEIRTYVSIGTNTDEPESKITFKFTKKKEIQRNKYFECKSSESEDNGSPKKDIDKKLTQIITPILQNANAKINSNSLIANITATLLQQTPKMKQEGKKEDPPVHGEDKTVLIIKKDSEKPEMKSKEVQTECEVIKEEIVVKEKPIKQYRARRNSSASSVTSVSSLKNKQSNTLLRKTSQNRSNQRNSSSNSVSSSMGSRWSRSRSRSRSRSSSRSEYSSYSSGSSRSRSRSRSISPPRRWHNNRNSRSRHRYNRSRTRSRSRSRSHSRSRSNSYRANYRHSRSPYSRSRSNLRRDHDSAERERLREVEERRVIYVGKISGDTTKADLRRRFQNFGPITNVSVHFRDHGDNYGFVTFQHKMDAYEAVERGNDDPNTPKYDISFGGRRAFCKTRYSDLDNIDDDSYNCSSIFRREEDSFDILLREVQAKLRKRKV